MQKLLGALDSGVERNADPPLLLHRDGQGHSLRLLGPLLSGLPRLGDLPAAGVLSLASAARRVIIRLLAATESRWTGSGRVADT